MTSQYFQDCEGWLEVPDLLVRPATASFARLYRCRPTEDPARKDKDELNTVLVLILRLNMMINVLHSGLRDMEYGNEN